MVIKATTLKVEIEKNRLGSDEGDFPQRKQPLKVPFSVRLELPTI